MVFSNMHLALYSHLISGYTTTCMLPTQSAKPCLFKHHVAVNAAQAPFSLGESPLGTFAWGETFSGLGE